MYKFLLLAILSDSSIDFNSFFSFNLIFFGFPAVESKLAPNNDHFSYLCLWVLLSYSDENGHSYSVCLAS